MPCQQVLVGMQPHHAAHSLRQSRTCLSDESGKLQKEARDFAECRMRDVQQGGGLQLVGGVQLVEFGLGTCTGRGGVGWGGMGCAGVGWGGLRWGGDYKR